MRAVRSAVVAAIAASLVAEPSIASAEHLVWLDQFGTRSNEESFHLATDDEGASYVVGRTFGAFDDVTSAGALDVFVVVHEPDGTVRSILQFGTAGDDVATGVATDERDAAYVVGEVEGALPGEDYEGSYDAFIRKLRPNGTTAWTDQYGRSGYDVATAVDVHGRGIYVASLWNGGGSAVLRRYSRDGSLVWKRRVRAGRHLPVDADASGVYVAGAARSDRGTGVDVLVRAYDHDGDIRWTRRFGSIEFEQPLGIDVRDDVVYVSGHTHGSLVGTNQGLSDAFVRTYTTDGSRIWTEQWGTAEPDVAWDVEVDASANAFVAGFLGADAFLTKFDRQGTELWTNAIATSAGDEARSVSLAGQFVYVAGSTGGNLDGSTGGPPTGFDGFVATFGRE